MIFLSGLAMVLTLLAPRVWLVLLTDGLLTAVVPLAAAGWGAWPSAWVRSAHGGAEARRRSTDTSPEAGSADWPSNDLYSILRQICLATALGLGFLGGVTLALGVAGVLHRGVAWSLIAGGGVAGAAFLYARQPSARQPKANTDKEPKRVLSAPRPRDPLAPLIRSLFLLPLIVPAAIMLFGAALPPGLIWEGEGNGYDALEYHLQAPREYFDAGRISFLPHNVYASFPQQMEMLYLLLMHLAGGPYEAASACQILHALCGVLAVLALMAWAMPQAAAPSAAASSPGAARGGERNGWAAILIALTAGSVPWLAYLGCLAYVELGMIFFTAVAAGMLLDTFRDGTAETSWRRRVFFAAGLCAGFAGGCKYTALALAAAALGVAWLIAVAGPWKRRLKGFACFIAGVGIAFSPWLARDLAFTGNPVYPFASSWFGGAAWSAEQAEQWDRGHQLPEAKASLPGRISLAGRELYPTSLFGPALFFLGLLGFALARTRAARMLLIWAALMFLIWATVTHMPGRFLVPVVVPLAFLASNGVSGDRHGSQSSGTPDVAPQRKKSGAGVIPNEVRNLAPNSGNPPSFAARFLAALGMTNRGATDHAPNDGSQEVFRFVVRGLRLAIIVSVFAGALFNAGILLKMLRVHDQRWTRRANVPLREMMGQANLLRESDETNRLTPADAHIWLVGDAAVFYIDRKIHYTVAFNRDPWLEFARSEASPAACVDWLRTRNVTHVVFSWGEIDRLRRTYGFATLVTPDWARQLAAAGLRRIAPETQAAGPARREIFEVLPK